MPSSLSITDHRESSEQNLEMRSAKELFCIWDICPFWQYMRLYLSLFTGLGIRAEDNPSHNLSIIGFESRNIGKRVTNISKDYSLRYSYILFFGSFVILEKYEQLVAQHKISQNKLFGKKCSQKLMNWLDYFQNQI